MAPTAPVPDPSASAAGPAVPGRWSIGSLTYTSGGLVALFFLLLLGDFAWSLKERSVDELFKVLLERVEASSFVISVLVGTLPAAIGMVVSPVISVWSDRARTRWGRRIPFLVIPTPGVVLAMLGLAFSPALGAACNRLAGGGPEAERWWVIAVLAASWTLFEVASDVANAVLRGLFTDVVPRAVIGRFFGLFRLVSLSAGIGFNFFVFGYADEHFALIFCAVAAIYAVGFLVMGLCVREGTYPPPPPLPPRPARLHQAVWQEVARYVRECFASDRLYLWLFATLVVSSLAFVPTGMFMFFAAKEQGLDNDAYGKCLAATYVCSIALAYPIGWLVDRFHVMRVGMGALFLYAVGTLAGYLLLRLAPGSSRELFVGVLIAHGVISGVFFTATASLASVMFPTLRFSQFSSAAGVILSLVKITVSPLIGMFIDLNAKDYRLALLLGGVLAGLALLLWGRLYHHFRRHGGVTAYQAPAVRDQ